MTHPTENEIGLYVLDATRVTEDVRQHVAECGQCSQVADDIRSFETELANPANWEGVGDIEGATDAGDLRAFEARLETEYQDAVARLRDYEQREAAPKFAAYGVAKLANMQTAGAVKRLCELANGMCERHPLYALTLAEAAVAIAICLREPLFRPKTLHSLRGEAWKEQANALRYLGRYPQALTALDAAEEELSQNPHDVSGWISATYVRAWILTEQEDFERAQRLAGEAAQRAFSVGDEQRYRNSRHLLGTIRFYLRDFTGARAIYEELLHDATARGDEYWTALESLAIGNCWIESDDVTRGMSALDRAVTLYTRLQLPTEVSRARWAISRGLFRQGRHSEAKNRLRDVIREMTSHGMLTDAAEAAVDLAEILLALGRPHEVVKLLAGVVQAFANAGKVTGALAALGYLKDAAAAGSVPASTVRHVRHFIRRAERQPELLFAAAPK